MSLKRKNEWIGIIQKKQRCSITRGEKLKIINMYENGKTITDIAQEFDQSVSTVDSIIKDEVKILESTKGSVTLRSTIITKKRGGPFSEMEKLLALWIEDMTQKGIPFTFTMVQDKAKSLLKDSQEKSGITESGMDFKASPEWFERLKKRIDLGAIAAETNIDSEPVYFTKFLENIIEEEEFSPHQIFNIEELSLFWKRMPPGTSISKDSNQLGVANDHITVMLGGNASGDLKLKPLTIYHSENPKAFTDIDANMLPVIWKCNSEVMITRVLFTDWFNNHFIPQVKEYYSKKQIPFKVLLLLNVAPGQPEPPDDFNSSIKVIYLPSRNLTLPWLQPMNEDSTTIFKALYLKYVFSQAIKSIQDGTPLLDFWKNYNILNGVKNIAAAWEEVNWNTSVFWTQSPMAKCASKLIQAEQQQTDTLTNPAQELQQVVRSCLQSAKKLDLDVDYADIIDLLFTEDQEFSNEDLIQLDEFRNSEENVPKAEQEAVVGVKKFTANGLAEAFILLDMALTKLESMDPNVERFENVSRRIQYAMSTYKTIYEDKRKATSQFSENMRSKMKLQKCEDDKKISSRDFSV